MKIPRVGAEIVTDVSRETSVAVFLFYFWDGSDRVGEEFHPKLSFFLHHESIAGPTVEK
jgi:hypothetical protein